MTAGAYDRLAPHYRDYARRRAAYCDAVDARVREWCGGSVDGMLDVGSGDGSRAVRLAASLGVSRLVLSEPSAAMAALCREHAGVRVWSCAAEHLPDGPERFQVVTCLWHVLGAIDGAARRTSALGRMAAALAPGGRLLIDLPNRYNGAAAGAWRAGLRRLRDTLRPSDENGVVRFTWQVNGAAIPAAGYLFTREQVHKLARAAGLVVEHEVFLDYDTGAERGPWTGQLVLALRPSWRGDGAAAGRARPASTRLV